MQRYLIKFKMLQFGHMFSMGDIKFPWRIIGYEKNPDFNSKADEDNYWNPFADEEHAIALALVEAKTAEHAVDKISASFVISDIDIEIPDDDYEWEEDPARAKAKMELMAFSASRALAEKQTVRPEIPLFFVLPCQDPNIKTQIVRSKEDWNRIKPLIPDNLKAMLIGMMATCVPVLTFWFVSKSDDMKQFTYSLYSGEGGRTSPFYGKRPYRADCSTMEYMFYDQYTLDLETAGLLSNHFNIFTMIPISSLVGCRSRLEDTAAPALLEELR